MTVQADANLDAVVQAIIQEINDDGDRWAQGVANRGIHQEQKERIKTQAAKVTLRWHHQCFHPCLPEAATGSCCSLYSAYTAFSSWWYWCLGPAKLGG